MVQRGKRLGFALKSCEAVSVLRESLGQDLDRHLTPESRVRRPIHLSHAAGANGGDDLVRADARAVAERHAGLSVGGGHYREFQDLRSAMRATSEGIAYGDGAGVKLRQISIGMLHAPLLLRGAMLALSEKQRADLADKLGDAANVAAGALVFSQFLSGRALSSMFLMLGSTLWL